MLALAHMFDLFVNKFSSLRGGRFAFTSVLASSGTGFFLGHMNLTLG